MRLPRFRTRLFVLLALLALVPSIVLTAAWSGMAARLLPLVGGVGAWEQVVASGDSAIRLARTRPGSAAADSALAAHAALLAESRVQARRVGFLAQRSISAVVIVGLVLLVVLTGIASRIAGHLSRQLSRPVDELVRWTTKIAQGAPLPAPGEEEGRGASEFGVLRDEMRRMAQELEAGRAAAIEAERLAAFRESARQVAHEIKNPLTPIRFAIARLRGSAALSAPEREAVEVLDVETARLDAMAKSFAQFGRLPEGPIAPVDLAALVRTTAPMTVPPEITLALETDAELVVPGRHDALQRALTNLLLNAIDAVRDCERDLATARITVRAQQVGGEALLAVHDTGCGVSAEALPRIWEPYVTAKTGGTGLGLAIVKQTVLAHGGRVEASSVPGTGTDIRLWFPRAS
ncbi:MAG: sensor histidine kinase [Gemmatimonadaceae bacterium]